MKHFFELLTDKRFSLKFRILNILSGDYLRNYLASSVYHHILDCERLLTDESLPEKYRMTAMKRNIVKAKKGMNDVWYL